MAQQQTSASACVWHYAIQEGMKFCLLGKTIKSMEKAGALMIYTFFTKIRHMLITLRVSILAIFSTLFVFSIALLIFINYYYTSQTLLATSVNLIKTISQSVFNKLNTEFMRVEKDNFLAAKIIEEGLINPRQIDAMSAYMVLLASRSHKIYQIYWADTNGTVINARREPDDSITSEILDRSAKNPIKKFIYRTPTGDILKTTVSNDLTYDPRIRSWYEKAKNKRTLIWTPVHKYYGLPFLGLTVAAPAYGESEKLMGVVGFDVRLDWISDFIANQKISKHAQIYIVTENGKLISYPQLYLNQTDAQLHNIHSLSLPWVVKSFDKVKRIKNYLATNPSFSFESNNETYFASFNSFNSSSETDYVPWIVGVVAPEDDFIGKLKRNSLISAGISVSILILGLLLMSLLVAYLVRPLKQLAMQTEKIRSFELDKEVPIHSRLKEVHMLSNAINTMRIGLQSFKKYVPATLVRQLIATGENIRVGGTKKTLTVLFSDIKDFTQMAGQLTPNELMEIINEYFEEISNPIIEEKGTIDKYMGDAVMAFWGAPVPVKTPTHHAAYAALKCERRLDALNSIWESQNKPVLNTRFGIHIGEAIVGNIGSSTRMNYTAIGDVINIARRLEEINKIYGTRIMVSEPVYNVIRHDFVLRMIDCIIFKGKSVSVNIYELMAENKQELTFDIDAYTKHFEAGFEEYLNHRFNEAIALFKMCLQYYPEDTVAKVFIERCHSH